MAKVHQADGSGQGKLRLSWGMGSGERHDAILLGLGRRKEVGQPLIRSSVEFQVYVSKMNVEERIRLVGSIEGRGEEGMRFGR
jgi:hypothetical protein